MAKFPPPETFDFSKPVAWPEWRDRFLRFRLATKLFNEDGGVQVSALIYAMGREADKIFSTFVFSQPAEGEADDRDNFDVVLTMFNNHFIPKRNVIHERSKFYGRNQMHGESVEQFLRALRELSATCDFADKEDESVRDRLVLGLLDTEVSQKLQLDETLTLKTAIDTARHYELIKMQMQDQRSKQVDKVNLSHSHSHTASAKPTKQHFSDQRGRGRPSQRRWTARSGPETGCGRCGLNHDHRARCPAKGKQCMKCRKFNHFSTVCRSARLNAIDHDLGQEEYVTEKVESFNLGSVVQAESEPPWKVKLQFFELPHKAKFKIDTGADVSVISLQQFNLLSPKPRLKKSTAILRGPGGIISNEGEFEAHASHKDQSHRFRCFVVKGDTDNLLSRDAAKHLQLIQRINANAAEDPLYSALDSSPAKCPPVHITLTEDHKPYAISVARRVPIPLMDKVKQELQRLESADIIEAVEEPTDWCAGIVPVLKKSGESVRITTDFKQLNKAVKRERYILPTIEDILHKLKGARVFSKLDATSGFFQLPLDEESRKLTTFITPFGRFFYKRLPQGISSAPEIFQRTVEGILKDQPHTVCFFDDILVFSDDEVSHKQHLEGAQKKLREANLKLNLEKCEFNKREIEFLGYIISGDGVRIDPTKTKAITEMPPPSDIHELRRFMGMVNFLGRHLPNLSAVMRPLSQLLEKDSAWYWGPAQEDAMQKIKEMISTAPTLAFYDPSKETIVSSDASSFGIGAVLLQKQEDDSLRPVAFCSRTLTATERKYAQIEKECLAAVWSCERFDRYLVGLASFTLETDHKPLVPLINTRELSDTPLRCQRMLMRLARFNVFATYTQGKNMFVADTLSRCPLENVGEKRELELQAEVTQHVNMVTASWPASDAYLERVRNETEKDPCLKIVLEYTETGWPEHREDVKLGARNLFATRNELSTVKGIITRGDRIVIPFSMQAEVLEKIHEGHMGIAKCRQRAQQTVWWPQISQDIKDRVGRCQFCIEKLPSQKREPLISSELPDRPFQRIATDICEFKNAHYLVTFDYFSRYIEISHLPNMTSKCVIGKLKNIFAHHGVPESVISDNGTQFTSAEFSSFASKWNFKHVQRVHIFRKLTVQRNEQSVQPKTSCNKMMFSQHY